MNTEVRRSPHRLIGELQQQDGLRARSYKLAQGRCNRKKTMKPSVDFSESLKDSPKFRYHVFVYIIDVKVGRRKQISNAVSSTGHSCGPLLADMLLLPLSCLIT